jgi:hypothetical protein
MAATASFLKEALIQGMFFGLFHPRDLDRTAGWCKILMVGVYSQPGHKNLGYLPIYSARSPSWCLHLRETAQDLQVENQFIRLINDMDASSFAEAIKFYVLTIHSSHQTKRQKSEE